MDRNSSGHLDETMNLRCFYLRLVKKIWIVPAAAVAGALIAAFVYTLVTVSFGPERTYSASAKLYLNFAYNEQTGTQVDSYNAYTWNMFMSTDDILKPIIEELKKQGIDVIENEENSSGELEKKEKTITKDELISSITAEIPSDIRVMLLTSENSDRELADAILLASVASMENFGDINEAFDSIKNLGITPAKLVVYSDKTITAAIFGAVLAVLAVLLCLLLYDALDDAVYVPEDCEKRYGYSLLGVLFKEKDEFFRNELMASFGKKAGHLSEIIVISTDSVKDDSLSIEDCKLLTESVAPILEETGTKLTPMAVPGTVLDNYRKIGTCDGVILCIPYGKKNGSMTEHIIAQLVKHECPIVGIVISRADRAFLMNYYGLRK
ncbi:MAG: hypothetical protein IJR29_08500 [Butyrivibrio sp.]|nr:hypothetical protein [Butyrivibrio sp.]